jgi:hypothetical protein
MDRLPALTIKFGNQIGSHRMVWCLNLAPLLGLCLILQDKHGLEFVVGAV